MQKQCPRCVLPYNATPITLTKSLLVFMLVLLVNSCLVAQVTAQPRIGFAPGIVSTVAGSGGNSFVDSGDGGPATAAKLTVPVDVALDGNGNLYIAEYQAAAIRKVAKDGTITTIAGTGTPGYNGDGLPATTAQLNYPNGIALDSTGNIYVADAANNRVRKISASDGTISTLAGNGTAGYTGDGGAAKDAELNDPSSVAVDPVGNVYIADTRNCVVRKVTLDGNISTVAGNGVCGITGDEISALNAEFKTPESIAFDSAGNLYIVDNWAAMIHKVTTDGIIHLFAGTGVRGFSGDGGPATSAQIDWPTNVKVDASGIVYFSDEMNQRIRKVTTNGIISTVIGTGSMGFSGDGGSSAGAQIAGPAGLTFDDAGNLYFADASNSRVRKVDFSASPLLIFSLTKVGTTSAAQDVSILNLGTAPLTLDTIGGDPNFNALGADTTCSGGQSLASGGSCVLGIQFAPQSSGTITGSIVVTDDSLGIAGSTQTIALQGDGTAKSFQTITFPNPGTFTYGAAPVTLAATATSNLPVSYAVTFGNSVLTGNVLTLLAGPVTIQATQEGDANWVAATPVSINLFVNKAPLSVTVNNVSIHYGDSLPTFTGTVSGVVNNDNITATYSTTATSSSPVGTYSIFSALHNPDGRLANYAISNPPGTLTIQAAVPSPSISIGAQASAVGLSQGEEAKVGMTFTSVNGFSGSASLSCVVNVPGPTAPTCSMSPTTVTIQSGKGAAATLKMSTVTHYASANTPASAWKLAAGLPCLAVCLMLSGRKRRGTIVLGMLLILVGTMASCGGNTTRRSTARGNYIVTVTATSGSISVSMPVTFTVY